MGQTATISNLAPGDTVTCTYVNSKQGTIIIKKTAVGGGTTFGFTGTGTGITSPFTIVTTGGSGMQTFSGLTPNSAGGSRSGTEDSPPAAGWTFTSLSCSAVGASTFTTMGQTATISNLAPGDTVTCTYVNSKQGTIIIKKTAVGGGTTFGFTGTGTGITSPFTIVTTGGSGMQTFSGLTPNSAGGSRSGTEDSPPAAGWTFTSLSCSAVGASTFTTMGQTATISNLAPGDTVTCTYVNSKQGTIVIKKTAVGGDATFGFTGTGTGITSPFTIVTTGGSGMQTFSGLTPNSAGGSRSGTEDSPPAAGWTFTSLSCSAVGASTFTTMGQTATISNLAPGDTVTCTYVNSKQGTIVIKKTAVGGDATFGFTGTGTGITSPFTIVTTGGSGMQTFSGLTAGTAGGSRSVTEDSPPAAGWTFTSLSCSAVGASTFTTMGQTATISNLAPGDTVTCTYVNSKQGTIVIKKTAVGAVVDPTFGFTASGQ